MFERTKSMMAMAPTVLAEEELPEKKGLWRKITKGEFFAAWEHFFVKITGVEVTSLLFTLAYHFTSFVVSIVSSFQSSH